jgi:hypothetical protein
VDGRRVQFAIHCALFEAAIGQPRTLCPWRERLLFLVYGGAVYVQTPIGRGANVAIRTTHRSRALASKATLNIIILVVVSIRAGCWAGILPKSEGEP